VAIKKNYKRLLCLFSKLLIPKKKGAFLIKGSFVSRKHKSTKPYFVLSFLFHGEKNILIFIFYLPSTFVFQNLLPNRFSLYEK